MNLHTKRQSAANNAFLREQKKLWNGIIYKRLLAIVNAEGEAAGRVYLKQFVRATTDVDALAVDASRLEAGFRALDRVSAELVAAAATRGAR